MTIDTKSKRKSAGEIISAQAKRLATLEESEAKLVERIKQLEDAFEVNNAVDLKALLEQVESLKADNQTVMRNIQRNSLTAGIIPGLDGEAKNFSLLKAVRAAKTNGRVFGDSKEFKILQEVREKSANLVGVDSDGGWFIPDEVIPDVIAAIYAKSAFLDLVGDGQTRVTVIDGLSGAKVRIPKFKSGVLAYWQGEIDESDVTKANVGEVNMTPKKLNALTRLTEEQIRWSGYQFENLLRNDMVRAMAAKVDEAIAYGKGNDNQPLGLSRMKNVQRYYAQTDSTTAPTGTVTGGSLDYTGLTNMDLLIEEANIDMDDTHATVSSPAFFTHLSNLRTLNFSGQGESTAPYLAGLPPMTKERLADIIGDFGKTSRINSRKPLNDKAAFTDVFRGNFGEVLVGRWSGLEVVTEDGYDIVNDTRLVKTRMWMDVGCRHEEAITWCADAQARPIPA